MEKRSAADGLSGAEEAELDQFVQKLLEGRKGSGQEVAALNDKQMQRLVQFISELQQILRASAIEKGPGKGGEGKGKRMEEVRV